MFLDEIAAGIVDGIELNLNIGMPSGSVTSGERYPLQAFIHRGGRKTRHCNAYIAD